MFDYTACGTAFDKLLAARGRAVPSPSHALDIRNAAVMIVRQLERLQLARE